jgi:hypothetical protein
VDFINALRYIGVPIGGPSWMFGDNFRLIKSAMIPSSTMDKWNNALRYHNVVHDAIACGYVIFCHIDGNYNLPEEKPDGCTKYDWEIHKGTLENKINKSYSNFSQGF